MSIVSNYWTIPGFEDLYLEDSWVLAIYSEQDTLKIDVDFVLRETHPAYSAPQPGEQYCYRRGVIQFEHVTALSWAERGAPPAFDAAGEADLGSFDEFNVNQDNYTMVGDFGHVEVTSSRPTVKFADDQAAK